MPLEHTIFKTKLMALQEGFRRINIAVFSSMIYVVNFVIGSISAVAVGDSSSNDGLWRTVEVYKLQIQYDCLLAQFSGVNEECGNWRSLVLEWADVISNLPGSADTFEDKLLEGHVAAVWRVKEVVIFEKNEFYAKSSCPRELLRRYRLMQ